MTSAANFSMALIHFPVYDKHKDVVATSVTNLDIHDMARLTRTFGLARYYIVTPVEEQIKLVEKVREHWLTGWGSTYNPKRKMALETLQCEESLESTIADIESRTGRRPKVVVTGASGRPNSVTFAELKDLIDADPEQPYLLLLGTGWGLIEQVFNKSDLVLEPIKGAGEYNHLSVRSAASIMLDRLFGR
ncbi:RNA methyltransferase [Geomonas oryzisoli]|uniref:RNA methyltransferase n=1 Tax=Geomonas oryzisoli TaxID=2847992 RepID=A0ABX8J390_9BACT|nr:RNA methyltransferase [Geomonas oryzisoli]QWV92748.1 RNA methyltransferase [Geomonas oryzisoli]